VRKYAALVFLLVKSTALFGQSGSTNSSLLTVPVPRTPEAASVEKHILTPTGSYTGVPKIEVPLFDISIRDLALPISLSYHAGGFRVADEASWVGLGWTLNAGGSISRTIKDKNDFYGWLNPSNAPVMDPVDYSSANPAYGYTARTCNSFYYGDPYAGKFGLQDLTCIGGYTADGILFHRDFTDVATDWEPDDFSYQFGSQSGKFVFNQQRQLSFLQNEKLLLTYNSSNRSWKAITAAGYQYFFEASASSYSESSAISNAGETEWYLTKIRTPLGEEATFVYEAGGDIISQPSQYKYQTKERTGTLVPSEPTEETTNSYSHSLVRYLARINFSTGYLLFQRSAQPRLDLEGGQLLQKVQLFSNGGDLIKEVAFNTSYFQTPDALTYNNFSPSYPSPNTYKDKRLRLDAVVEKSAQGVANPATVFTYNTTPLPSKTSYAIDYWGFYNGANSNTDLLPRYEGTFGVSGTYGVIPGANREPDANAMKALVLQKITYPTGGSTYFTFEPNQYSNLKTQDIYESAGQQIFSCVRDDVHPYYNTPAQTLVIKNQTPEWGGSDPTPVHVNLLFTDNIPNDYQSKGALRVILTGPNGFSKAWGFSSSDDNNITSKQIDEFVSLAPGTYQLTAYSTTNSFAYPQQFNVRGDLSFPTYRRRYNMVGGGLRVAKIVNRDGSSRPNVTRTYEYIASYKQNDEGQQIGVSSGIIPTKPIFARTIALQNQARLFQLCSASLTPASAPVTYSQVTTYVDSLKLGGKQVQYFTNVPEREPIYSQRSPSVPNRRNLTNGYLEGEEVYEKTASGYQLKKTTSTSYEQIINPDIRAIYRGAVHKGYQSDGSIFDQYQDMYYYPVVTGWVRPTTTVVRNYEPTGSFTQSTSLFYDTSNNGHMQVSRTETQRSDGSTMVKSMTYPADYPTVTTGSLAAMRGDAVYQHNAIVESVTQVYGPNETLSQARTLAGTYTEYTQPNTASGYLPVTQQTLDLTQPTTAFSTAMPNLPPVGRYVPKMQLSYDPASANIQQTQRPQDVPTTYVWGYQNTLLLASVLNASTSQVQTALAAMGTNLTTLATVTDEAQLQSTFAQLRQRLPQARITSFTYQPLAGGMTSETKPDGRLLRYEYDGFQRLLRVRDEVGRILTQQEYKLGL
jgi:YD repeat-containing protein